MSIWSQKVFEKCGNVWDSVFPLYINDLGATLNKK